MEHSKRCYKCKTIKPIADFYKNKSAKDGHQSHCKPCNLASNKKWQEKNLDKFAGYSAEFRKRNPEKTKAVVIEWRLQNKEHIRKYSKNYRIKHPEQKLKGRQTRRARRTKASVYLVTTKDLEQIMSKACIYCGAPSQHLDHIIPLSRGGAHSISNLVAACATCNLSKYNKFITEWRYGI